MIEQDHDFHTGFEFIQASIPANIFGKISRAVPKQFMTVCRNVGRSLLSDEDALNTLKRNRRERAYELIWLGEQWGRRTKKGQPNGRKPV